MHKVLGCSFVVLAATVVAWPARAQETASDTLLTVNLYLAEGEPKGTQLFVRWMDAEGASSQITRVTEKPSDPKWAPDGKAIAFVMLVPDSTAWSISLPKPPEGAKWTPAPRVVDDLHYRHDRVGYMTQGYTHLFLVPADGGTARALTNGHWNVGARFDGLVL